MDRNRKVTRRDAEKVLAGVRRAYRPYLRAGYNEPMLVRNWRFFDGPPVPYAIVWEGGPFEWTMHVPFGGRDEEFGGTIPAIDVPDGIYTEPYTGWALGIYPS